MNLAYRIFYSLFVAAWFVLPNSVLAQSIVKSIRSNDLPDKQQIVIDVEDATNFNSFSLPNPPRIVVDVDVARLTKIPKDIQLNPQRVIGKVRTGIQSDSKIRVVIDLLEKAPWEVYAMTPEGNRGHRVVIDVLNKGEPMAGKQAPKTAPKPLETTEKPTKKTIKPKAKVLPQPTLVLDTVDPENAVPLPTEPTPTAPKKRSLWGKVLGVFGDEDSPNKMPPTPRVTEHSTYQQATQTQPKAVIPKSRAGEPGLPVNIPTGNRIHRFRVNRQAQKIQFVVDVDRSPTYEAFELNRPNRLVVDVASQTAFAYKDLVGKEKYRGIQAVRQGVRSGSVKRLVFDLADDYRWEVTRLLPDSQRGHRLVIDIYDNPQATLKPTLAEKPQVKPPKPQPPVTLSSTDNVAFTPLQPKKPGKPLELVSPDAEQPTSKSPPKTTLAKRSSLVRPDLITVVIDPGHGGRDSGAVGANGTKEKTIMLNIAKRLKRKIDKIKGMRAVLTRSRDKYVSLPRRVHLAREYKADLFVSIHANSFSESSVFGSSTYVLSEEGSSEAADRLAEIENAADEKHGIGIEKYDEIGQVLFDIQQDATIESSYIVAQKILSQLKTVGKVHKRKVERANFSVLRSPGVPSVLIETAFISNPKEEKRLLSPAYQEKIANALVKGIKRYFKEYLPHRFTPINTAPKTSE